MKRRLTMDDRPQKNDRRRQTTDRRKRKEDNRVTHGAITDKLRLSVAPRQGVRAEC
jgi:hypothetical protein